MCSWTPLLPISSCDFGDSVVKTLGRGNRICAFAFGVGLRLKWKVLFLLRLRVFVVKMFMCSPGFRRLVSIVTGWFALVLIVWTTLQCVCRLVRALRSTPRWNMLVLVLNSVWTAVRLFDDGFSAVMTPMPWRCSTLLFTGRGLPVPIRLCHAGKCVMW